jgi:hypothetical protein
MMDAGRRRRYMMGMCDAMGIALHRLTGLPLVKVIARKRSVDPDFFEWDEEPVHIAVKQGSRLLDAAGWIGVRDAKATALSTLKPPFRVIVEPISEEEAAELFTVEGVTEEQIEEAVDDALADPVLAPILEKMR